VDLFREILSQAKSRVSASGGTLYFVYLPGNDAYIDMARKERPRILDLVRALGIPLIDIVPAFQAQSDPLSLFPFRGPGHYNKQGHRLVAEEVLKTLFLAVN
jgi:lysophospholipase L1-like esterase